jgi:hypothetical protein
MPPSMLGNFGVYQYTSISDPNNKFNGCGYLVQIKIQDPGKALVLGQGYAKICPNVQVYPE